MASLSGILHRPLSTAVAVAVAAVSSDLSDKFSHPKDADSFPTHAPSKTVALNLARGLDFRVSRISFSNISFVSRIQNWMCKVEHPSSKSYSLLAPEFLFSSFSWPLAASPALLTLHQYAKLARTPKPVDSTSADHSSSSEEVMYRWHLPKPSSYGSSGNPDCSAIRSQAVVVLLGWLGAKQKHLKTYADWYTSRGFNVITFTLPMTDILSYKDGGKAEQNLDLLAKHLADCVSEEQGKNLIFHTFSNTGWIIYGVVLENFQKQDPSLMGRIRGCIVDSAPVAAPDPQVWGRGGRSSLVSPRPPMASISPSAWPHPPSTSMAAASSPTTPKPVLVLPRKQPKGRRLSALAVRASPTEPPERTTPDEEPAVRDRVKLALARAKAYQKENSSTLAPEGNPGEGSALSLGGGSSGPQVPDSVKIALEGEYTSSQGAAAESTGVPEGSGRGEDTASLEAVKLAMERARGYEGNAGAVEESGGASEGSNDVGQAVPDSVKLAMERAREYKKNKGAVGGNGDVDQEQPNNTGLEKVKVGSPESLVVDNKVQKLGQLKVSSLDFLGLDFSEKKNRGVPAGLVPVVDNFSDEDLPEIEIIVGDASKFGSSAPSKLNSNEVDDNVGLYKPKVSTWGVFPRPSNISKTFGGGKNIHPGEVLESAEVKAAKEERTRELIASYKSKIGLTIDAKMKAECEKALKEGDRLLDIGKLQEALPYYEKIMKKLAFQSELHGIAALQWSICQDSLRRSDEARVMYERLQSHPSVEVSKKARQFMFGFQAMEMMKVSSYSISKMTGYEDYFDAFLENKVNYAPTAVEQDEDALNQALPYVIFLVSPVLIVLAIAIRKSFNF